MTKPVKMISARMVRAVGTSAWNNVLDAEPTKRNIMDMTMTVEKLIKRKKKNGPGSLRKLVMKYNVRLKMILLVILKGISQIMDATASSDG